jgi:hypothetical protein
VVKYLIYGNEKLKIKEETGKYWLCEKKRQFRKNRPDIEIKEIKERKKTKVKKEKEIENADQQ